jgi:transposase, IS605 orfB family
MNNAVTFVTRTVVIKNNNKALYIYFDEFVRLYQFLYRKVYHNYRHNLNNQKESQYRSDLMKQFHITNRMAKAIMLDVKTSINSHKSLFDYQLNKSKITISKLFIKIIKLKERLQTKRYGRFKTKINLQRHLFKCQVKLNKLKQFVAYNKQSVTFGTKKLLKSNINKFLSKRDNQINYYGDKNEHKQNQQFQIAYNIRYNRFDYKIRLDNEFIKDNKYIYGSFYLKDKQAKNEICNILKFKDRPLSYKIIKCNDKLYLHIMFRYNTSVKVGDSNGVLGIDFNKGFITMSNINKTGKLLKLYKIPYIHKAKTGVCDNSLNQLVNDIINISLDTNKPIVIEDLKSLNNKKLVSDNKKYNSMINLLKFSKFKEKLINKSCKTGSDIKLINPAYTSQIAQSKYCYAMKLNVHSGASYVIARRYYNLD